MSLDWTSDTNAVLDALGKLATEKPKRRTALYDACYHAVEMAKKGGRSKRAVILFSDGIDVESAEALDTLNYQVDLWNSKGKDEE